MLMYPPFLLGGGSAQMNPGSTSWLAFLGSYAATAMFVWAMVQQFCPPHFREQLNKYTKRWFTFLNPYIQIRFNELAGERFKRSEAFLTIENYLSTKSSTQAKRLKADIGQKNHSLVLSMDDNEEVVDEFRGVKLWWFSGKHTVKTPTQLFASSDERRYYILRFHKKHRELVMGDYLNHVMKEGKAIKVKNRQRKLYTNNGSYWSHIVFEHPATFQTLAMEPEKKEDIMEDLIAFTQAEEFYSRIGRAWKRGYLLFGPPGTGKSTMISAIANFLEYDLYDLELTSVRDNMELRKLLIDTSSKSVIVIEDIDCSLDLTGQRKKKKKKEREGDEEHDPNKKQSREDSDASSRVTLSGLLNFIDGIWSASGGERLIVFTTNHIEKLDPALIRKGRMDKHIELSYCRFEAFKVLAKNYLGLDSHELFGTVGELLEEVDMSPADVAEQLMPTNRSKNADDYLKRLIRVLEESKEAKGKAKAVEEEEEAEQHELENGVVLIKEEKN